MDLRASFRASHGDRPNAMFKALRRLHGQNLESRGLNDMTEAFQSFVTRARFFSVGKLRRTWSHSAAEFMKYRRLLPMLLADGQQCEGMETDDFDAVFAFQANSREDRKILVSNISPRITASQLQSFFSQFGKVSNCSLPREERKQSIFATLPKNPKNCGTATITFKHSDDARKAREATPDQLRFYDQVMTVTEYVSKRKGGKGMVLANDSKDDGQLSRASSIQSLTASTTSYGEAKGFDELPPEALESILAVLPAMDTVRCERVNKRWMEASMKSWSQVHRLSIARESEGGFRGFSKHRPLRNSHLRSILRRAGVHLRSLDVSGVVHLLDDKALSLIATHCPQLKELDISGVGASWEALSELSDSLPSLQRISYSDMANTGDKSFWFLLRGCGKSLVFLDLRGASRLRGRCLKLLGPELEVLYLDGCSSVDSMAFEDLCTNSAGLKELRTNECYQITDQNLSMISRLMPDLQVFTLCGDRFEHLTRPGLLHIAHIQGLVELALDYNVLVDDALLVAVCEGLPLLKTLSIANAGTDNSISARGIVAIAQLKALDQLDVSSLAAVRSSVLKEIAAECPLELLQLRNCVYLNDEGVVALAKCQNLRHVDLSGSILVTSDSVQELIKAFPQDEKSRSITVVVGGTACDASRLRVRGSRVVVDFSDYSSLMSLPPSRSRQNNDGAFSDADDDEFESLAAQRSFYIDAVCGEDESPVESEEQLRAWAEAEAKKLGLIK